MTDAQTYIMDHPQEGQRLIAKVDAEDWISKFLAPHLPGVTSLLSVGCGPGVFLGEVASKHPKIEVAGVDLSRSRIQDAERRLRDLPNAKVFTGDAQALPFEENKFDLVFCRFLLEYLPDKQRAVQEMKRVCSCGGKVLLQDLDGQLIWHFPEDSELQLATEKVLTYLAGSGFDPFVGRKLFSLCLGAGLNNIRVQVDPYHLYAGSIGDQEFLQWQSKLDIARPQLSAALGSEEAALEYTERFLEYLRSPETLTYSCLFTVTGTKP
jgi:SAM-dependent methyltransferase